MPQPTVANLKKSLIGWHLLTKRELAEFEKKESAAAEAETERDYLSIVCSCGLLTETLAGWLENRSYSPWFGRCRIDNFLGRGQFGEVFQATHVELDQMRAVKVVDTHWLNDRQVIQRFRKEAKAVASLDHPNIVRIYDAGKKPHGPRFLTMEFLDGRDLGEIVKQDGPMSEHQVIDILIQATTGLEHAHRSLFHRDIKPANIILTVTGIVKLLDFGLSLLKTGGSTQTNNGIGTPATAAPEQSRHGKNVDASSDLYSLGCTAYFLITGEYPYGTDADVFHRHRNDPIPSVFTKRSDVSRDLDNLLRRLMAKQKNERFRSASELLDSLTGLA